VRKEERILVMMQELLHPLLHPFFEKEKSRSLARRFIRR
jgi:hypothetical protein